MFISHNLFELALKSFVILCNLKPVNVDYCNIEMAVSHELKLKVEDY